MAKLLKTTREIMNKLSDNELDRTFIKQETEAYEKRIANAKERITNRKNRIEKLRSCEFFVNVSDVLAHCAKEWQCSEKDMRVTMYVDRCFSPNMSDSAILASTNPMNEIIFSISHNGKLFMICPVVYKGDIQLDGKTFQEHLKVRKNGIFKQMIVSNPENIVFRYRLVQIVEIDIENKKIEFRDEDAEIVAMAIKAKEDREDEVEETKQAQEKEIKAKIKNNSLLRLCPDCGGIISWCTHFQAFQHGPFGDCAYMEDSDGKRVWDNAMRKEKLIQEYIENEEYEKEC